MQGIYLSFFKANASFNYPGGMSGVGDNLDFKLHYIPKERGWFKENYNEYLSRMNSLNASKRIDFFVLTTPYVDYSTSEKVITFSKPIIDRHNNYLGVSCIDIYLSHL